MRATEWHIIEHYRVTRTTKHPVVLAAVASIVSSDCNTCYPHLPAPVAVDSASSQMTDSLVVDHICMGAWDALPVHLVTHQPHPPPTRLFSSPPRGLPLSQLPSGVRTVGSRSVSRCARYPRENSCTDAAAGQAHKAPAMERIGRRRERDSRLINPSSKIPPH